MGPGLPPNAGRPGEHSPPFWTTTIETHRRSASVNDRPSSPRSPRPRLWGTSSPVQNVEEGASSSPATSDSPFNALSPGATDRVFPIRSVVSVDPTQTPQARSETSEPPGEFPGFNRNDPSHSWTHVSEARSYSLTSAPSQGSEDAETPHAPRSNARLDTTSASSSSPSGNRKTSGSLAPSERRSGSHRPAGQIPNSSENISMRSESVSSAGDARLSTSASAVPSTRSVLGQEGGETERGIVTSRFKHVVTAEGHAIVTGRDGDTLQRCEDEPIHIPGAVQGFGLLIALREEAEGRLAVRIVSENSKRIIGYTPRQLFELDSFLDVLSEEQADNLLDQIDFIRDGDADPATNGPEVFTLSIRPPKRRGLKLWCAIHINENNPDLVICEFELDDDQMYPLAPVGEGTPEPPEDTLNSNPTVEELAESTVNASRPLRVLRSARKRKGEAAAMEVFNIMSQVQEQLASATSLESFLKILVGVVKELTGFHRVMIYQFDHAWNGRVVTELLDPRATKDLYKGLHFPASDIPKQARELYKVNKVRLLYDRDLETARLVCREMEDLDTPLDLTYSYLRAMSPIHIKYLANMAVRASMSISINAFNELWGLISCHAYGSKGMRVSFPIRKMCRLVGDAASRNIERLSYASRLQARKLINTAPTQSNPSGYIVASSDDLLKLFDADFGLLSIRDETKILGKLEQSQEALAMLEYLRLRKVTSVQTSHDVHEDFPDLRYAPGFHVIAGLLLVPLSVDGSDFIVFFRKGQTEEVRWAGNPYEKFIKEGTEGYLEPRKSFKVWSETVIGRCREWTDDQLETAAVLCLVYGKFIDVWRQKEAALQSSQLTRLLLANSAHEVRTPLNAIINYLEIALEGSLDQETRENLGRSHSASKSLIYVINDLLDLTKTEEGGDLIKDEAFDLPSTVREAADTFAGDAKRKQIDFDVIVNPHLPRIVIGDQRRVRQAVSNVMANAIQHTSAGGIRIELWLANKVENSVDVDIVIQDTGSGMSPRKLDALFRDLEQVQTEGYDLLQEGTHEGQKQLVEGEDTKEEKRTLGLGLAVVARILRNMNGQLRLKSEEGKGSRFVMQFPFYLSSNDGEHQTIQAPDPGQLPRPTTPSVAEGEMMLVMSSSAQRTPGRPGSTGRKTSAESVNSLKSFKTQSSGKGGVDRLIGAIQEPHMRSNPPEGGQSRTRPGSVSSKADTSTPFMERPPLPPRARSERSSLTVADPDSLISPTKVTAGQLEVMDSKVPVKPVRMPEIGTPISEEELAPAARVLFNPPDRPSPKLVVEESKRDHYNVLVAEDDPVNSKIIKKRLKKSGHVVQLTVNGEECASMYGEKAGYFDLVLMDMQMPIVDGLSSTKMIRSFEKSHPTPRSSSATLSTRVPIFAVSASLIERDREQYTSAGFDGWILKPIDFKRLNILLAGIADPETRTQEVYKAGHWEKGGWFHSEEEDCFAADTVPSGAPASTQGPNQETRNQPTRTTEATNSQNQPEQA
ncbi:MAG: Light-sensor Protein kinase [Sclerophora amabilis]|nr:MAG: Light-sensor Protein kinase [Sclerophora amabilis]